MNYCIYLRMHNPRKTIILWGIILFFISFLPVTDTFAQREDEHACEKSCGEKDEHIREQTNKDENNHDHSTSAG